MIIENLYLFWRCKVIDVILRLLLQRLMDKSYWDSLLDLSEDQERRPGGQLPFRSFQSSNRDYDGL